MVLGNLVGQWGSESEKGRKLVKVMYQVSYPTATGGQPPEKLVDNTVHSSESFQLKCREAGTFFTNSVPLVKGLLLGTLTLPLSCW